MVSKPSAKQEVAKVEAPKSNVPAYLAGVKGGSGLVGLDSTDYILPRIKLLQGISKELEAFEAAKNGIFWLNVLDIPLGNELEFIVCSNRKRYLLLPPIGDARGILARADDGVHWVPPDGEWQVKLKNIKNPVTWTTAATVRESGLAEFGSSNPDDPDSNPAATLFYEYVVYLPQYPDLSPALLSLARSQAKKARDLNGKIEFRKTPMQSQKYIVKVIQEDGPEGPYNNYTFVSNGFASEDEYKLCCEFTERYKTYRAADEEGLAQESSAKPTDRGEL